MIKEMKFGYQGMSKDVAKDKNVPKYFDAKNIRIIATDQQSSFAVTNEHGNELSFTIPTPVFNLNNTSIDYDVNGVVKSLPYTATEPIIPRCNLEENYLDENNVPKVSGQQVIVGTKDMRNSAVIISTDDNGFDCFWELTGLNTDNLDLELRYMNNIGLNKKSLVQILYNYENSIIEKIYFVDGKNQLRLMNLRQSIDNGDLINLVDLSAESIDSVSSIEMSQIEIENVIAGGNHTSGVIQYAYSLYILNGAQTVISPLSEIVSIDKGDGLGGGEVNEDLGRSVIVKVPHVDDNFTHIKIYAIKYTAYNTIPQISLVEDREIDNFNDLQYYDDGSIIESVSLEALAFLGSDPIIPKHIVSKDSRLFPINIKEKNFDVEIDTRAYSHNSINQARVWENIKLVDGVVEGVPMYGELVNNAFDNIPLKHDSINHNYDLYKFQKDGMTVGAEGKYLKIEIDQTEEDYEDAKNNQYFKDRELYRLAISFYNKRGQKSLPKWMADIKMPSGNLEGKYNKLKVTLKPEFYVWLNDSSNFDTDDDKPTGYRILRSDRTARDRTIVTQGMINPMVSNYVKDGKNTLYNERRDLANSSESRKMPSMTRMFETMSPFLKCKDYFELSWTNEDNTSFTQLVSSPWAETHAGLNGDDQRAQTFQFNKMMQMFSPEVVFDDVQVDASLQLNIVGLTKQGFAGNWTKEVNKSTGEVFQSAKFLNGFTIATTGHSVIVETGSAAAAHDQSFFGPTNKQHASIISQVYRKFDGGFHPVVNNNEFYNILGTPEITNRNQGFRNYNNKPFLRYANNLSAFLQDNFEAGANSDAEIQVMGASAEGFKCITFVEGVDNGNYNINDSKSIDRIFSDTGISETKGVLVAEFVKNKNELYLGNIYGGNTYEAKSISSYIPSGSYTKINQNVLTIKSPGDTYVHDFKFTKLVKPDLQNNQVEYNQYTEIVSYRVETTVDLKNRNDLSISDWDVRFQPKYNEYQQYNRVYTQKGTLIKNADPGFKFKKIKEFDTRIMASKEKIPGENIDSWTDFLVNETMDLDGKYGPINAVVNSNDEIFTLQDSGVAMIAINPRVQTTGADGIGIELGSGGILHDYKYISSNSGTLNKWGVVPTQNGFYYFDSLNKGIMAFSGGLNGLSDQQGFHSFFLNNIDFDEISKDNPVLNNGVSCGYNSFNNDVYFSFRQRGNSFTICYNEATQSFVSFYGYIPAWYITKGSKLLTTNPSTNQVWEHFKGNRNSFYGVNHPSSIEFNVAPDGDRDCIFNNAHYKMEMTTPNNVDIPNLSLSRVRLHNDYQDSGQVQLVNRFNINRKFRHWKVDFPRNKGTKDRIRNPWTFIEFSLDNPNGNKMVLHDITIHYNEY